MKTYELHFILPVFFLSMRIYIYNHTIAKHKSRYGTIRPTATSRHSSWGAFTSRTSRDHIGRNTWQTKRTLNVGLGSHLEPERPNFRLQITMVDFASFFTRRVANWLRKLAKVLHLLEWRCWIESSTRSQIWSQPGNRTRDLLVTVRASNH